LQAKAAVAPEDSEINITNDNKIVDAALYVICVILNEIYNTKLYHN
jgi:hypothetical protein